MRKFRVIVYFDKDGNVSQATWEVQVKATDTANAFSLAAGTLTANVNIAYRMEIHELFDYG